MPSVEKLASLCESRDYRKNAKHTYFISRIYVRFFIDVFYSQLLRTMWVVCVPCLYALLSLCFVHVYGRFYFDKQQGFPSMLVDVLLLSLADGRMNFHKRICVFIRSKFAATKKADASIIRAAIAASNRATYPLCNLHFQ